MNKSKGHSRKLRPRYFRRQITIYLTPQQAQGLDEMAARRSSHPATLGREAIQFFLATELRAHTF